MKRFPRYYRYCDVIDYIRTKHGVSLHDSSMYRLLYSQPDWQKYVMDQHDTQRIYFRKAFIRLLENTLVRKAKMKDQVLRMYQSGQSIHDIAAYYHVTTHCINYRLRQAGVTDVSWRRVRKASAII